ncbi:MAG: ribonucleotide reductase subunit alpha [Gammaproteobacteria bacterium]
MNIGSFDDLLQAARVQPDPQRLLFVFAASELPDDASDEERARFEAGEGGALRPVMTVDKLPTEVLSFDALREESKGTGAQWDVVFVASLSGRGGIAPNSDEADQPLQMMVQAIHSGTVGQFLAFHRDGDILQLS